MQTSAWQESDTSGIIGTRPPTRIVGIPFNNDAGMGTQMENSSCNFSKDSHEG